MYNSEYFVSITHTLLLRCVSEPSIAINFYKRDECRNKDNVVSSNRITFAPSFFYLLSLEVGSSTLNLLGNF